MEKLFFLILLFGSVNSYTQTDSIAETIPASYLTVGAGIGLPLTPFNISADAGAKPARGFLLNWAIPVKGPNLGLYFQFSHNIYNGNDSAFIYEQTSFANENGLTGEFETSVPGNENWFALSNFIAGIFYTQSIEKFSITVKIGGGFNSSYRNGSEVASYSDVINNYYQNDFTVCRQEASVSKSFVLDMGFGTRYLISNKHRLYISLDADYLSTNGEFSYSSYSQALSNGMPGIYDHNDRISFKMNAIAINLGISFAIGKRSLK